jgi:hypothetical protein
MMPVAQVPVSKLIRHYRAPVSLVRRLALLP